MDWWNVSVFGIIPVLSVLLVFFIKRKFLWVAPLISTVVSVVISVIAIPSILTNSEGRAMFFWNIYSYASCNRYCSDRDCLFRGIHNQTKEQVI